jgi:predicted O-linked N-acetylglucosamine transferase (SPINDLY family)
MRAMEIDIAIDLSGYTAGSRLDILAHQPAPAQATYLGFPGGLNVPYIDYLIADRVTVPEDMQKHYREKILYLPHCYLPRDTSVKPSPDTPKRADFGLPDDGLVFCSFNHDYKINPPMFEVWMELLRENPKSVLWLMKLNEDAQRNLAASANAYDIDPSRLVFATRVPRVEDHLARYRLANACLDTFPYNGHTTTSDALWSGSSVVTLRGNGFASRVPTSLNSDLKQIENVCDSFESYKGRANYLAHRQQHYEQNVNWPYTETEIAREFSEKVSSI